MVGGLWLLAAVAVGGSPSVGSSGSPSVGFRSHSLEVAVGGLSLALSLDGEVMGRGASDPECDIRYK